MAEELAPVELAVLEQQVLPCCLLVGQAAQRRAFSLLGLSPLAPTPCWAAAAGLETVERPAWCHPGHTERRLLWFNLQDMAPYVPKLMPKLKDALVDPLPEVRATAAKALGSLLKGMGEEYLQDILPYLRQKLKSEVGGVEQREGLSSLHNSRAVVHRCWQLAA